MKIPKYIQEVMHQAYLKARELDDLRAIITEWDFNVEADSIYGNGDPALGSLSEYIHGYIDYGEPIPDFKWKRKSQKLIKKEKADEIIAVKMWDENMGCKYLQEVRNKGSENKNE